MAGSQFASDLTNTIAGAYVSSGMIGGKKGARQVCHHLRAAGRAGNAGREGSVAKMCLSAPLRRLNRPARSAGRVDREHRHKAGGWIPGMLINRSARFVTKRVRKGATNPARRMYWPRVRLCSHTTVGCQQGEAPGVSQMHKEDGIRLVTEGFFHHALVGAASTTLGGEGTDNFNERVPRQHCSQRHDQEVLPPMTL
jgi:hypothetical protein